MGIFLLIVVGLVAWFFISAMNRAKTRMAYADVQDAQRQIAQLESEPHLAPSWVHSRDRQEEFVHGTLKLAERNGTPLPFGSLYFTEEDKVTEIMHFIALLERRGSNFTDQKIAATRFISERFLGLPTVVQEYYVEQGTAGVESASHGMPTWAQDKPIDAFVEGMNVLLRARSVPPTYFAALMTDAETVVEIMKVMADAERDGASLEYQRTTAALLVQSRWLQLSEQDRKRIALEDFRKVMRDGSDALKFFKSYNTST